VCELVTFDTENKMPVLACAANPASSPTRSSRLREATSARQAPIRDAVTSTSLPTATSWLATHRHMADAGQHDHFRVAQANRQQMTRA
jgi:hypothetical protein